MSYAANELIIRGLFRSGQITGEKAERMLRELAAETRIRRKKWPATKQDSERQ